MSAPTPPERAAEQFTAHGVPTSVASAAARDALSAALDRDELARVLLDHRWDDEHPVIDGGFACVCGFHTGFGHDVTTSMAFSQHLADALIAHLLGEVPRD